LETIFKNILLPIDGSLQSKIAQEMALFIGKTFSSQVTVIHVVSDEFLTFSGRNYILRENYAPISNATGQFPRALNLPETKEYVIPEEVIREVNEEYKVKAQGLLVQSAALFTQEGIAVKEKLVEATDIAESVIAEAETGNYDLVVMGNSGAEENEVDLHLGSIAAKVSLNVRIPILVVRSKREVKKILIPVDGSVKDEKTLQNASAMAKATGSKVVLLHVQEKSLLKLKMEIKEIGFQILKNASEMLEGIQLEQKLVSGDPAKSILETSVQDDVDLIIMNGGGHEFLRPRLFGSVSDHVLRHAAVPVLLVK
jgi:nucleotide-binding universal stress UspA family protein